MFGSFPLNEELLKFHSELKGKVPDVNAHIHTPYSFSAFESIRQAVSLAKEDSVKVLGINDFNVTDGYFEFAEECLKANIFPLFNIEFIGLVKVLQEQDIKVNDWNNPGRIYLSGKGLSLKQKLNDSNRKRLNSVLKAGEIQITEMINKLNVLLNFINRDFHFSLEEIRSRFAIGLVRERHLAKAIRVRAEEIFSNDKDKINFYRKLLGKMPKNGLTNSASLENEIRASLLKAGGKAFVPEDKAAFMLIDEIKEIIFDAGGIPVYPVLLDDAAGNFTDMEATKDKLLAQLLDFGIYNVEFIPARNNIEILTGYVRYFYDNGFSITFGTEHNTPKLIPLKIYCRSKVELDEYLKEINYKGACVLAAHQFLVESGHDGYQNRTSKSIPQNRAEFESLGAAILNYYIYGNK